MARSLLDEQGNSSRKVPSGERTKHGESLKKELPYQWRWRERDQWRSGFKFSKQFVSTQCFRAVELISWVEKVSWTLLSPTQCHSQVVVGNSNPKNVHGMLPWGPSEGFSKNGLTSQGLQSFWVDEHDQL